MILYPSKTAHKTTFAETSFYILRLKVDYIFHDYIQGTNLLARHYQRQGLVFPIFEDDIV